MNKTIELTAQQKEYQEKIMTIIVTIFNEDGEISQQEEYQSELTPAQILNAENEQTVAPFRHELVEKYGGDWATSKDDPNCTAYQDYRCAQTLPKYCKEVEEDWTEYRKYQSCAAPHMFPGATILHATEDTTWLSLEVAGETRTYQISTTSSGSNYIAKPLMVKTSNGTFQEVTNWTPSTPSYVNNLQSAHIRHIQAYLDLLHNLG